MAVAKKRRLDVVFDAVDFISLLPTETICRILSYLSLSDIVKCLRVSSRWYSSIQQCTAYWMDQTRLSRSLIQRLISSFPSLMHLVLRFQGQCAQIKAICCENSMKKLVIKEITRSSRKTNTNIEFIGKGCFLYIKQGTNPEIQRLVFNEQGDQLIMLGAYPLQSNIKSILWSCYSKHCITILTDQYIWCKLSLCNSAEAQLQMWENVINEFSQSRMKVAGCTTCSHIVVVDRARIDRLRWEGFFVNLISTEVKAQIETLDLSVSSLIIPMEVKPSLQEVIVFPKPGHTVGDPHLPCNYHCIVLLVGQVLIIFQYSQLDNTLVLLKILCHGEPQKNLMKIGSSMKLSSNGYYLVVNDSTIWDLDSMELVSDFSSTFHQELRCIAIGVIYTILVDSTRDDGHCFIVTTSTGQIVHKFQIGDCSFVAQDEWLNTCQQDIKNIIFIAIAKGQASNPQEIIPHAIICSAQN